MELYFKQVVLLLILVLQAVNCQNKYLAQNSKGRTNENKTISGQQQKRHEMDPTCSDRMPRFPTRMSATTAKLIQKQNSDFRKEQLGFEDAPLYFKYVFFINGTKEGQQFVLCTMPKSGASRAYMMMYKLINPNYKGRYTYAIYKESNYVSLAQLPEETIAKILADDNIPKIAFVRDPYIRVVSMFKDKVDVTDSTYTEDLELCSDTPPSDKVNCAWYKEHNACDALKDGYCQQSCNRCAEDKEVNFENFVTTMYDKRMRTGKGVLSHGFLDRHFVSQTQLSLLPFGMQYNYILKVEEINDWYDCFIDLVNIREEMMHGWQGKDKCYFSTPHAPCKGPQLIDGVFVHFNSGASHNHGSVNMLNRYYQDPKILKMVTEMYQEDLINFNYTIGEVHCEFVHD